MEIKNIETKIIKMLFFIFILLCVFLYFDGAISNANAQDSSSIYVASIVKTYHDGLLKYESVMLKYAKILFYWCAVFEVAWLGIKMALGASDLREILKNLALD